MCRRGSNVARLTPVPRRVCKLQTTRKPVFRSCLGQGGLQIADAAIMSGFSASEPGRASSSPMMWRHKSSIRRSSGRRQPRRRSRRARPKPEAGLGQPIALGRSRYGFDRGSSRGSRYHPPAAKSHLPASYWLNHSSRDLPRREYRRRIRAGSLEHGIHPQYREYAPRRRSVRRPVELKRGCPAGPSYSPGGDPSTLPGPDRLRRRSGACLGSGSGLRRR